MPFWVLSYWAHLQSKIEGRQYCSLPWVPHSLEVHWETSGKQVGRSPLDRLGCTAHPADLRVLVVAHSLYHYCKFDPGSCICTSMYSREGGSRFSSIYVVAKVAVTHHMDWVGVGSLLAVSVAYIYIYIYIVIYDYKSSRHWKAGCILCLSSKASQAVCRSEKEGLTQHSTNITNC